LQGIVSVHVFATPMIGRRLAAFKALYYLLSLRHLPETLAHQRKRRLRLAAEFSGGTTRQDPA